MAIVYGYNREREQLQNVQRYIRPLVQDCGRQLTRIALRMADTAEREDRDPSLAEFRDAVRKVHRGVARSGPRKGWTLERKVREVRTMAGLVVNARKHKRAMRRRKPDPLDTPLRERYERYRARQFRAAYLACGFRQCESGGHEFVAEFDAGRGRDVACKSTVEFGDTYSRRCLYQRRYSRHYFRVRPHWMSSVHKQGLARLGNMLTLSASTPVPVDVPGIGWEGVDATVRSAKWVRQGRGSHLIMQSGYIAQADGVEYHGTDLHEVMDGLRRKVESGRRSGRVNAMANKLQAGILPENAREITVSVSDSLRAGNCRSGTASWVARYLQAGETEAPLRVVLRAARQSPPTVQHLVYQVCAHAVLRHERQPELSCA